MFSSNTSAADSANYIEDVFSTWLYTGNSSTQTITNGIDLAGKGGLVWVKSRSTVNSNVLFDTQRGALNQIQSNAINASTSSANSLTSFNGTGFSLGTDPSNQFVNFSGVTYASWTFREQPKFFDVVTYTGTGANRTVAHNLGSVPGCIIVKRTDTTGAWQVYHRSLANTEYMVLNTTAAVATGATRWNSTTPTDTVFSLGTDATVNASGGTYVAYLFAHNAGGFGLTGTDNVISCGSYTGNGSTTGPVITLDYEPQWVVVKNTSSTGDWRIFDSMRGVTVAGTGARLDANSSAAEQAGDPSYIPTATGFTFNTTNSNFNSNGNTYIYIAIRRGPMKTPTTGTSVFAPVTYTGSGANRTITTSILTDASLIQKRTGANATDSTMVSRLTGNLYLRPTGTDAETASTSSYQTSPWDVMNGIKIGDGSGNFTTNTLNYTYVDWAFRRAPGFMDVCCYTGTGGIRAVSHNLTVAPELLIVKSRTTAAEWFVWHSSFAYNKYIFLNRSDAAYISPSGTEYFGNSVPTASIFNVGPNGDTNGINPFVAYLFASCPGVSKVGSYTGTGTTQQINCGFTGGARFVLIKRTDSTGDWYVWDSARGIVAGNDPYLLLNSTAAEVTSTDYIDTFSSGFEISSTAPAAINASGGTFIFLAIA